MGRRGSINPFAAKGRSVVAAILATITLVSVASVALSVRETTREEHKGATIRVASRQRTLADRYVEEVLLSRAGARVDPGHTATLLSQSAKALLDGGAAPEVEGDDDETTMMPATATVVRRQLQQQRRLISDLTRTGQALLAGRPVKRVRLTAHEHPPYTGPVRRLRELAALTSNVSLNVARTISSNADNGIGHLITTQVVFGALGLLVSLLLAGALIATTRRQTAHFRSLVTASTDLVLVFGSDGCRYVSRSVTELLGRPERELLGDGILESLDADERARLQATIDRGRPHELVIRLRDKFGAWRHLEARVTDLRGDRHVRGVVLNARDITERVGLEEELIRQAFHDSLTGLANRGLFRDRVDQALARATRSGAELAVLFIDLSGLKEVNDSVGHEAGDELLKEVAQRFSRLTRPSDTLARLGGDEFALLLEETDEPGAVRVARRLLERLSEPLRIGDRDVAASASVGIVVDRGGSAGGEDLLRHADVAMYAAKQAGRGRCEVFRHEMAEEVFDQLELERQLRQAVRDGEFVLYYQPEIELETGATVGAEALLRWRSPERGLVMPAHFIPMAESTELIVPLGAWVVEEACRQAARWQRDGLLRDGFVTWVNLSAKQLAAGGVSEVVRNALASSGLSPGSLGLEVTESTIVEAGTEGERARAQLQDLRDMGVRIAIDDFGTGFSSHRQLRQLPADVIKIDRSFLQGIEQDPKDAAITENLVRLSQAIGVVTVAEGIETEGQLARLRKLGCELGQGFLFSRPVPAADMTELLATGASLLSPREAA